MKCPRDGSKLVPRYHETNIEIDLCRKCHGMWLDKGELEAIQETIEHDYSKDLNKISDDVGNAYEMARQKHESPVLCPKCDEKMDPHEYGYCSQIIVDVCPSCEGVWLDQGELQALEIFFEKNSPTVKKGFFASLIKFFK